MSESEVRKITDKLQKLRALRLARERVRQLERALYGEAAPEPQEIVEVPEFLRASLTDPSFPSAKRTCPEHALFHSPSPPSLCP